MRCTAFTRARRSHTACKTKALRAYSCQSPVKTLFDTPLHPTSHTTGNDLSTPAPQYGFPGLQPGQRWCLCAGRWWEAYRAGQAPPVVVDAVHQVALQTVPLEILEQHAVAEAGRSR